jgi:beta-glucosidase
MSHVNRWFLIVWAVCMALVSGAGPTADPAPLHAATTPVPVNPCKRRDEWLARHEAFKARARQGGIDLLFLGDSITEGWETAGRDVWAKHYGRRKAAAFGIGGDATQHLLWRLEHGELDGCRPRAIVVLIGTNNNWASGKPNTPEQIADGVNAVLARLREKAPDATILVMALFARDAPDAPARKNNEAANRLMGAFDDGARVRFRDVNGVFLDADGALPKTLFPDGLHPNAEGYERWAAAIEKEVAELLGETIDPADGSEPAGE